MTSSSNCTLGCSAWSGERLELKNEARAIESAQKSWEAGLAKGAPAYWAPSSGLVKAASFDDPAANQPEVATVEGRVGRAASFDGKAVVEPGQCRLVRHRRPFHAVGLDLLGYRPGREHHVANGGQSQREGIRCPCRQRQNPRQHHQRLCRRRDPPRNGADSRAKRWYHIAVSYAGSRMADGVTVLIDGKPAPVKVFLDTLYRPFGNAGKAFRESFRIGGGWGAERRFRGLIDDVRIYNRVLNAEEIAVMSVGRSVNQIAGQTARTQAEIKALRWYFLENAADPAVRETWKRLTALDREREALERTFPTVMVMAESPKPKDTFLLIRGAYDKHGQRVEPGVPEVLNPLSAGAPNNRLGLAKWLVDPANPLTARVTVNRFWQMYFGAGLVKTTEDFGLQGEWPSNPDLLDWLATEFIRSGWDVKAMQKLIVMSATYRQSSKVSPELMQRDPENRLLARGPRHRLAAEMVRDQALYAAGLLVEKLGGPSVKPYQPDGLWKEQAMQDMDYRQGTGRRFVPA